MKKFVAVILVVILSLSCALAECKCTTGEVEKKVLYDLIAIEDLVLDREECEIIYRIVEYDDVECGEARQVILNVLLLNYDVVVTRLSAIQIAWLVNYVTKCCCCEDAPTCAQVEEKLNVTPAPKPSCTHTGATHENGGKCTKCGTVYEKHVVGEWESRDSTWHYKFCSCGVKVSYEYHKWDGKVYSREDGMVKKYCTICHDYSYVYDSSYHSCNCADCGGCCDTCTCGCH